MTSLVRCPAFLCSMLWQAIMQGTTIVTEFIKSSWWHHCNNDDVIMCSWDHIVSVVSVNVFVVQTYKQQVVHSWHSWAIYGFTFSMTFSQHKQWQVCGLLCTHTHIVPHTHTHTHTHSPTHSPTHTHTHTHTVTYTHTHTHPHTHTYTHTLSLVYAHSVSYSHTNVHTPTHIISVHTHGYPHNMYTHTICIHTYTYTHYMHTHIQIHTLYAYTHTHTMCIHTYTYTHYMHTHIHTQCAYTHTHYSIHTPHIIHIHTHNMHAHTDACIHTLMHAYTQQTWTSQCVWMGGYGVCVCVCGICEAESVWSVWRVWSTAYPSTL